MRPARLTLLLCAIIVASCKSWGGFWTLVDYGDPPKGLVAGVAATPWLPRVSDASQISSFQISPGLPAGLSFNTQTGAISGTPQTARSAVHTVGAYDKAGQLITATSFNIDVYNFGSGKDGPLVVSGAGTDVNPAAYVTNASLAAGTTSVTVNNGGLFVATDLILIAQMQNASGMLPSEYATLANVAGNVLTLAKPLRNSYTSNVFNAAASSMTQVVLVRQYTDVTVMGPGSIVAAPWTGQTGGIIAFRATGTVTIAGAISANQIGFRGGVGVNPAGAGQAFQGESYPGYGIASTAANAGGGGGGANASNVTNAAGGLAGYATVPADTFVFVYGSSNLGTVGSPGNKITNATLQNLYLGSGGGGLGQGSSQCGGTIPGGAGGGIVIIDAYQIEITTGSISADGTPNANCTWHYQPSGPGSGGSMYLRSYIQRMGTNLASVSGGYMRGDGNAGVAYAGVTASDGMIRRDYGNKDGSDAGTTKQAPVYTTGVTITSPLD